MYCTTMVVDEANACVKRPYNTIPVPSSHQQGTLPSLRRSSKATVTSHEQRIGSQQARRRLCERRHAESAHRDRLRELLAQGGLRGGHQTQGESSCVPFVVVCLAWSSSHSCVLAATLQVICGTRVGAAKHHRVMPGGALEGEERLTSGKHARARSAVGVASYFVGKTLDDHRGAFLIESPVERGSVVEGGWDAMELLFEVSSRLVVFRRAQRKRHLGSRGQLTFVHCSRLFLAHLLQAEPQRQTGRTSPSAHGTPSQSHGSSSTTGTDFL
jgi:hypothetical protein